MSEQQKPQGEADAPSIFDLPEDVRERMIAAYDRGVRNVRNTLFLVAAMIAVFALLSNLFVWSHGWSLQATIIAGFNLLIIGTYIGLGYWAMRRPFYAVMAGIGVDLILQTWNWIATGSVRGGSLLTFVLFVSVIRKAKVLQQMPLGK